MEIVELTLKEIAELSSGLAKEISKSFSPDCIVYVAKAAFPIGREFSRVLECPLIGVSAARRGNSIKKKLSSKANRFPEGVKNIARLLEIRFGFHKRNTERDVRWLNGDASVRNAREILIVDDSVDTGSTMKAVKKLVQQSAPDANIKIAALNVCGDSKDIIGVDYYKYSDTILKTPMSVDSREYQQFLQEYEKEVSKDA